LNLQNHLRARLGKPLDEATKLNGISQTLFAVNAFNATPLMIVGDRTLMSRVRPQDFTGSVLREHHVIDIEGVAGSAGLIG
jgi:hypothetical protein